MALSLEKIVKETERPSKSRQIRDAIAQQERIKFHADTNLDVIGGAPFARFRNFVKSMLPDDKFLTTMNLLKFPLVTNEITESVFVKLSKIFDGRNPALNYQFHDTKERDDWEWYRQEVLGEPDIWQTEGWEYFKTEINSVLVVDMPRVRNTSDPYPQPYFYFVPITSVISYWVNNRSGNMDWIIYRNRGKIIVIDEKSYRVFATTKEGKLGALESESEHDLGYCPSRFFWNESLTLSNPDVKRSPLSKELSDLDWFLFQSLGKRHLDISASYPIYSGFEEECDYSDKDGNVCHHGHLQKPDGTYLTDATGNIVVCPLCHGKKSLAGPGTYVSVPIPEDGQPDLRDPIHILNVDRKGLDYNVEENQRLRAHIINACVGADNTIINELSLADKQIEASYESRDVVLNRVKKGFEVAQQFVDSTICRLRYGESFINATISYGTEFYTLTPEVLQKRYAAAKENGASEFELDSIKNQLLETQYRHDPITLQRMLILAQLEPYRHSSRDEVLALLKEGVASREEVALKTDFMNYVRRFERENDNILEFGLKIPFSKKITTIYQTLLSYAAERNS